MKDITTKNVIESLEQAIAVISDAYESETAGELIEAARANPEAAIELAETLRRESDGDGEPVRGAESIEAIERAERALREPRITKDDEPRIREWLNCETAEVDENGDVWVEGPLIGHWLRDEQKRSYLDWRAETYA